MTVNLRASCGIVATCAIVIVACRTTINANHDGGSGTGGTGRGGALQGGNSADSGGNSIGGAGGQTGPGGGGGNAGGFAAGGYFGQTGGNSTRIMGFGGELPFCSFTAIYVAGGDNAGNVDAGIGGADGGTPSTCPTTDEPPSDPAALRVYQLVEAQEHADLQRVVGQYACGDSPIYRGTFVAGDNFGTVSPADGDGMLNNGPVIAAIETTDATPDYLTCEQTVTGARALVVIATAQMRAIRFFQPPAPVSGNPTYASLVHQPGAGWSGTSGECNDCVADLRGGAPASIDMVGLAFSGQYCGGAGLLMVSASGHLTMLAAPTFADILEMNQNRGDQQVPPIFVVQGPDLVTTVDGSLGEGAGCTYTFTPFHVDWYVNQQNPRLRGLRNFRIDSPQTLCCRGR